MWDYRIMCERVNLTELCFLKYIKAFKQWSPVLTYLLTYLITYLLT
jgi:hypothetical protein